jgi:outer membrane lipoprotein-sorting protein
MRRFVITLAAALAMAPTLRAGTPGFMHMERSEADSADLDRISRAFNAIHTLRGAFVQIGPDGQDDEGVFYIEKPGRMRFEYHAPNPVLIVSDGSTVAVENRKLGTLDHYPIWSTPLDLILADDVNLNRNPAVVGVSREPGELIVSARESSTKVSGNLTLVFSDPGLELRQWTIVDAQGLSTTVSLRDVKPGVSIDPGLFALPSENKPSDKGD